MSYHRENNPPPLDIAARCVPRDDDKPEIIDQRM